jgi:hypothetical protein
MYYKNLTKDDQNIYTYLRNEIHKARVRIKMSVDYYGKKACIKKWWTRVFNVATLLASSIAIYSVFSGCVPSEKAPVVAGFMAVVATITTVINIVAGFEWEQVKYLQAQYRARILEQKYDSLWIAVDSELLLDFQEIRTSLDKYGEEYQSIEQAIQPHAQSKRLALEVQDRIENGLKEDNENEGESKKG